MGDENRGFSLGTVIDSEILGSQSLSLPSEPPDIRLWFPSYRYESPEIDLIHDLEKETGLERSEDSNDRGVLDFRKRFSDESDKILGSHSLSLPSEPPDIGNWFPSYQYESPQVDLSDDDLEKVVDLDRFEDADDTRFSDFGKRFSDESDKVARFDKVADQEHHPVNKEFQVKNLDEITELPASLKKLFSSKKGEEEDSDGAFLRKDDLIGFDSRENNRNSPRKSFTGRNCEKDQLDKRCSKKTDMISSKNNENHSENNAGSLEQLLSRRNEDGKQFTGENSRKFDNFTSKNNECFRENKGKTRNESWSWRNTKNSGVKDENSLNKLPSSDLFSRENGEISEQKNEVSLKEIEGRYENFDFISTKNGDQFGAERGKGTVTEEGFQGSRRALSEITNSDFPSVFMPVIAGKWKCPRRSKPDLGPPLKQLRLERWVRRV